MRLMMFTFFYIIVAAALEIAVLPQFALILPRGLESLPTLRLLAMGGILVGLLRGETPGMLAALAAALLFGFSGLPGYLGAGIASFSVTAFLAGRMARAYRFQRFLPRLLVIWGLLAIERLLWCSVRWFFWPGSEIRLNWGALLITALIGAAVLKFIAPRLKDPQLFARSG